jgi:hypothetical protein
MTMYYEDIAPDIWRLDPEKYGEPAQDRSFLIQVGAVKALRPVKGKSPRDFFSRRDPSRRTGYPVCQIRTD